MRRPLPPGLLRAAAAGVLAAGLLVSPAALAQAADGRGAGPAALAKGGKDQGGGKRQEDPRDKAEWKECDAIGAAFLAKADDALAARIRPKGSITLALGGGADGDFQRDQAGPVLRKWFDEREILEVTMTSLDGLTGTLKTKLRAKGKDASKAATRNLYVVLEKKGRDGGFWLTKLELGS